MTSIKLVTVLLFFLFSASSEIYTYSVPKIEGGNQALNTFSGKRLLIITLPIQQNLSSDSLLYSLDTLAAAHQANLAVIAVPAYEDGFTDSQKNILMQWYRSKLGNYITLTNGLNTRKTSGNQQHPLFKWLTSIAQNESFNIDVEGPGYKFFIRENGELYGVLRSHVRMGSLAVNRTIKM